MRSVFVVTACLVFAAVGRRIHGEIDRSSLKELAMSLMAFNPQATGVGAGCGHAARYAVGKRALIPDMWLVHLKEELEEGLSTYESRYDIEVEAEVMAQNVRAMYDFPYIPDDLEHYVIKKAVIALGQAYPCLIDGLCLVTDKDKAEELFEEAMSDCIVVPLLSKVFRDDLVEKIMKVMDDSAAACAERREILVQATRAFLKTQTHSELAGELNAMVDIPLLCENTEQWLAEKTIEQGFNILRTMIPGPVVDLLQTSSPEELREVRQQFIERVDSKIDIPFVQREQEKAIITFIVDFALKRYGLYDVTVLPIEKQKVIFQLKLGITNTQLKAHQIAFKKNEAALVANKEDLQRQLQALGVSTE